MLTQEYENVKFRDHGPHDEMRKDKPIFRLISDRACIMEVDTYGTVSFTISGSFHAI